MNRLMSLFSMYIPDIIPHVPATVFQVATGAKTCVNAWLHRKGLTPMRNGLRPLAWMRAMCSFHRGYLEKLKVSQSNLVNFSRTASCRTTSSEVDSRRLSEVNMHVYFA